MPATEQTWRDAKLLHKIFAISGAVLLFATVIMLYVDHARTWKPYQRTRTAIDLKMTRWREQQFETEQVLARHAELAEALASARRAVPDLKPFEDEVQREAKDRGLAPYDFSRIQALREEVAQAVTAAQADVAERNTARDTVTAAEKAADAAEVAVKTARADFGKAKSRAEGQAAIDAATKAAAAAQAKALEARTALAAAEKKTAAAEDLVNARRQKLFASLQALVKSARVREDSLLAERKFANANLDAAKANLSLMVRDNRPEAEMELGQKSIDKYNRERDLLSEKYEAANDHRKTLQKILAAMTEAEDKAKGNLDGAQAELKQLKKSYNDLEPTWFTSDYPLLGKKWLTLPILTAFNSPERIDQIWLPELTQDFNFKRVPRFDRCTTCHQAIQKTLPGTKDTPAFVKEHLLQLTLSVPAADQLPPHEKDASGNEQPYTLAQLYGMEVAAEGLISPNSATVSFVQPESRAAKAVLLPSPEVTQYDHSGLAVGDVIELIDEDLVARPADVRSLLTRSDRWGRPVRLTVRRGLPNPYISHPRLDLYVGDSSPHKMMTFGCTICHEGQDTATAFKWASHSPNNHEQQKQWADKYGWFDNHDWRTPMYPERFIESGCIKCHHEVVELRPSERFPDPPAAKLVHGYDVIRKYGCYGCHEINGYDGPNRRIGPDLRLEPNYFAYGLEVAYDLENWKPQLEQVQDKAQAERLTAAVNEAITTSRDVAAHPDNRDLREGLIKQFQMLKAELNAAGAALPEKISGQIAGFKEVDPAGTMRKPGPSLRYVKSKLDPAFMADWIYNPSHFRPTTRMPQFFGLYNHLQDSPESLQKAQEFEPVEVLGILEFLRSNSQPFEYLPPAQGMAESTHEDKVARGKVLFETRGCLACHNHQDFPEAAKMRPAGEIVQGPDLSGLGAKFAAARNPAGRPWLYSWLKKPTHYHARTVMPDLFLEPIKGADGKFTDPIDDIAEFLLSVPYDWQPAPEAVTALDAQSRAALDSLSLEHLKKAFHERVAQNYLKQGIPESERAGLKGAEVELVGNLTEQNADHKKLMYIGRKAIAKYGCFGCHDIPTFEDAKSIGTGLADWGRKDPARLAFEHVTHYVEHQRFHGGEAPAAGEGAAPAATAGAPAPGAKTAAHDIPADAREYFEAALEHGNRTGFLYQKLKEPRSYDYKAVENKPYNDRLRMPQFPFTHEDREAVMTFVLGLTADPPAPKYVYTPTGRQKAIVEGEVVLEKFNCAACHILGLEEWKIAYEKDQFKGKRTAGEAPSLSGLFPYVEAHFTSEEMQKMAVFDPQRGVYRSTLKGLPVLNSKALPDYVDAEGEQLEPEELKAADPAQVQQRVELWQPAVLNTQIEVTDGANTHKVQEPVVHQPGVQSLLLPGKIVEGHRPARGGFLTKYLLKPAFDLEKQENPQANAGQVWGWLPPVLVGEGHKVQAAWLHDFLLDPHPIRPAVFLRMPKFNMSSDDATKLVNYFAAVDSVEYPYVQNDETRPETLAAKEAFYEAHLAELAKAGQQDPPGGLPHGTRFDDAMRMVVSKNYCVQCHVVADFKPDGRGRPQGGPDLTQVSKRLRPDYVRRWIANPKQILPYTPMPQNVPYDPTKPHLGAKTQEYHGNSVEQVDALTDLLMNYDTYAKTRSQVKPLVEASKAEAPPAEAAPPAVPVPAPRPAPAPGAAVLPE